MAAAGSGKKPDPMEDEIEIEDGSSDSDEDMGGVGPLSEAAQAALARQQEIEAHFDDQEREKQLVLPTRDDHIKLRLRELEHPICLFGEGPGDRRDRLKRILLGLGLTDGVPQEAEDRVQLVDAVPERTEAFLTEGPDELKRAREYITKRSLLRARRRLDEARRLLDRPDLQKAEDMVLDGVLDRAKRFNSLSSEVGGDRPTTACAFNRGSALRVATGSWDGRVILWSVPRCERLMDFEGAPCACRVLSVPGHETRVCDVSFHPRSGVDLDESAAQLVSASQDRTVALWALDSPLPVATLTGHVDRVNKALYHPFGRHIISASFDRTWRLWDAETCQQLLLQEGHSQSIYAAAAHGDGSVLATGGLDSRIVMWDLRSGRSLYTITNIQKPIFALDWSPNGYLLASGHEDHSCKLHDVRMRRVVYTIPAHTNLVSGARFEPETGAFLVTSSFDSTVNVWDAVALNHAQLRALAGHEGHVMAVDVSHGGEYIASAGRDRTWKLFAVE